MSVTTTIATLATKLLTVNPAPQPALQRVFTDPAAKVTLADAPFALLMLDPSQKHRWRLEALGGAGRHDYTILCLIVLGAATTPLPELHSRLLPWPEAIADVLMANLTLGGGVTFLGDGASDTLFEYSVGPISWGSDFFGISIPLPVTEIVSQTFGG